MPQEKEIKEKIEWQKTADIANRYGKDGWISTLKNAIDILLIKEKQKWVEEIEKIIESKKWTFIEGLEISEKSKKAIIRIQNQELEELKQRIAKK